MYGKRCHLLKSNFILTSCTETEMNFNKYDLLCITYTENNRKKQIYAYAWEYSSIRIKLADRGCTDITAIVDIPES